MLPSSLVVSVVTFRPDIGLLDRCLRDVASAIRAAREAGVIRSVAVALIDNSEHQQTAERVIAIGQARFAGADVQINYLHGHANIGYGTAHNLMLHGTGADYQLVLNPDVEIEKDAFANAIRWLDVHPEVGAIAPSVRRPDGTPEFLCKRYPAVFDLLLRGFAPRPLRALFRRRLNRYEMRDRIDPEDREPVIGIPILSGACILARRKAIDDTGGFDPGFFLYFEDFDWSVRLARVTKTAYLPSFRIVHHGGHVARKGAAHVKHFVKSGVRFYRKHGWRWF